ncbi:MAG: TIR domain-containing protein [Bryobacteraceae bacterium]
MSNASNGKSASRSASVFEVFQDRAELKWGENWKQRIDQSLDSVTFLIAILSPSFFQSRECVRELERFRERELRMGRSDLILAVIWITPDEITGESDQLGAFLRERQYTSWEDYRHYESYPVEGKKRIESLARDVKAAIRRVHTPPAPTPAPPPEDTAAVLGGDEAGGAAPRLATRAGMRDGKELKQLIAALLAAYPNYGDLEQMVLLELGESLASITSQQANQRKVVWWFGPGAWTECKTSLACRKRSARKQHAADHGEPLRAALEVRKSGTVRLAGDKWMNPLDGPVYIWIPPGTFLMGA